MRKVLNGFSNLKKDISFFLGVEKSRIKMKYKYDDYKEKAKVRQVKSDVIKFIPFSFFIVIPGAEILLPPYLVIFPNSIPSQFLSAEARQKKLEQVARRRESAAKKLNIMLPNYLYELEKDSQIHELDLADIKALKADLKKTHITPIELLHYKRLFK